MSDKTDKKSVQGIVRTVKPDVINNQSRFAVQLGNMDWYNSFGKSHYTDQDIQIEVGDSVTIFFKETPKKSGSDFWKNIVVINKLDNIVPEKVKEEVVEENKKLDLSPRAEYLQEKQIIQERIREAWIKKSACRIVSSMIEMDMIPKIKKGEGVELDIPGVLETVCKVIDGAKWKKEEMKK